MARTKLRSIQVSFFDLLKVDNPLELLNNNSDEVIMEQRKKEVEENRSGIMSAFVKSMRMKKINESIYYGALLLLGGQNKWYVSRRVLISACEDGNNQAVMEYVHSMYRKRESEKTIEDVLLGAVAVCLDNSWFKDEYGNKRMKGFLEGRKLEKQEASLEEFKELLYTGGYENYVKSFSMLDSIRKSMDYEFYLEWLANVAIEKGTEKHDNDLVKVGEILLDVVGDLVRYKDGNWEEVVRYMICVGTHPNPIDFEGFREKYLPLVTKILEVAREDLISGKYEIPTWAYDNMHASNKKINKFGGDKRFAGTPQGFLNCILQYKKYGRIDPRDQAELKGLEVPEEGLRLFNEKIEVITL